MSPDELQELVLAGAPGPLVHALAPLDAAARRILSKRAFELLQAANDFQRKTDLSKLMGDAASRNAELAVLACCDGSKAKQIQISSLDHEVTKQMLAVLLARKPAWIDGWIKHLIDKKWVPGCWWSVVRGLVRAGVASKPAPQTYINLMVNGIAWRNWGKNTEHVSLSTLLLEDPDLLETEIWQSARYNSGGRSAGLPSSREDSH